MTLNPFIPQCQISLAPVDNPHYHREGKKQTKRKVKKEHGDTLCLSIFPFEISRRSDSICCRDSIIEWRNKKCCRKKRSARTKFDEAGPLAPGPCRSWLGWLSKAWKSTVSASKWKGRLWRRHLLGYRLNFIGGTCQQFAIPPSLNCW